MDKDQIKLQYEILGEDVQAIAKKHNISAKMLEYLIEEQKWERLPIAKNLRSWKYSENPSDELLAQVKEHSTLINTLRISELGPKIMAVELALVNKVHEFVSTCEKADDLKKLAEIIQILSPQAESDTVDEGLKIMVVNQFGESSSSGSGIHLSEHGAAVGGDVVEDLISVDGPARIAEISKVTIDI